MKLNECKQYLSDKLVGEKGKTTVKLQQYSIFEVKFKEEARKVWFHYNFYH